MSQNKFSEGAIPFQNAPTSGLVSERTKVLVEAETSHSSPLAPLEPASVELKGYDPQEGRVCVHCDEWKPSTRFNTSRRMQSGLESWCYDCRNERRRAKAAARSPEKRESDNAKQRQWRQDNKERVKELDRNKQLMKAYGISLERYNEILEAQEYRCAICGTDSPGQYGTMVVDHDHETDAVRGLLCNSCNKGLGCFKDSQFCLESAIAYLTSKNDWRVSK